MATLVLLLCYLMIAILFREDSKGTRTSLALWIPGIWLFVLGTRPISLWFGSRGQTNLEGSWINAITNLALILGAFFVLQQRRFNWGRFAAVNKALLLLYLFYALSPMWSSFPWPTFKRIFINFGNVVVALVLATEKNADEAMWTVYRRVAFFILPLSIVTIRYFPAIGRSMSKAFEPMFTGLSTHKNSLGEIAFVLGLVVLWDFLANRASLSERTAIRAKRIRVGLLLMAAYLVYEAHSTAAQLCFAVGIAVLFARDYILRFKDPRRFATIAAVVLVSVMAVDQVVDLQGLALTLLGKDKSLTGRTEIWDMVRARNTKFLLGSGFRGFWETNAGLSIGVDRNSNVLLTAHNGYLETYLNGGIIGVALLVAMLWSGGGKALRKFFQRGPLGAIALVFWVVAVLYNNSESDFFIAEPLWFTWLLVTMDCKTAVYSPGPQFGGSRIVSSVRVSEQIPTGLEEPILKRAVL